METFGSKTTTKCTKEESYAIAHSFLCAEQINNYTVVKLNANGTVSPLAADTDKPFGLACVGNQVAGERVTVLTPFVAIVEAPAEGAITAGATVQASVYANGTQKYKAGTTTPIGVALTNATDGQTVEVGILRIPLKSF